MSAAPPLAFPAEDVAARALRILSEHAGSLERLAASYARSRADRADLLQDIALGLWLALPGFREACSERTFVLRIAHNRALTFLSKRGVRTEDIDERANDVVATTGKNPAIVLERGERDSRLLSAVRALPVAQRQVITLLLEGLSQREIAEIVGASVLSPLPGPSAMATRSAAAASTRSRWERTGAGRADGGPGGRSATEGGGGRRAISRPTTRS